MEQPFTFGQFLDFFNKVIDPQLQEIPKLRADMEEGFRSVNGRLDYLFTKWEKLDQAYLQFRKLERRIRELEKKVQKDS